MKASLHAPALGRADRYVLQVRLVAGEPPGDRHRLRIVGVHAAGPRVDHLRQLVGVGALELGERAVLEQPGRQRIVGGELLQLGLVGRRRAGRRAPADRQAELAEQDLADLLRRAEVERLAGELVGLRFERQHALGELAALRRQQLGVDQHAGALDARQQAGDRHLDAPVDVAQLVVGLDARPQHLMHDAGTSRCPRRRTRRRAAPRPARKGSCARPCRTDPRRSGRCGRGGAAPACRAHAAGALRARSSAAWCRAHSRARACRRCRTHGCRT